MAAPASLDWQFQLLDLKPSRTLPTLVPPPPPVEPGESVALRQLRASLDPAIAAKVRNGAELLRDRAHRERTAVIPTTLESIDLLLHGGLPRGKMVELTGRRASGRFSIVLSTLVAATSMGETAALIDLGDHFSPAIAEADGVDLRRLLWIRPATLRQAVVSAEMIAATGFQLVVLDTGLHPIRGRRVPDASWVRLARTAEAHGAAIVVSSPYALTGTSSEALLQGCGTRARWLGRGKSPRLLKGVDLNVTLERHRHIRPGATVTQRFEMLP